MICRSLLVAAMLAAAPHGARAADWTMDAAASRLEFAATFERALAPGVFTAFDTQMRFDAERPTEGRLDVTIVVKSADMNSADVNKAIAGAEWFDFARFPQAEFRSTEIVATGAGRYSARGMLKLKGIQKPVEVPFTWVESGDAARLEGEFSVRRGDFGIGTGEWAAASVVGADVKVRFKVRMRKRG